MTAALDPELERIGLTIARFMQESILGRDLDAYIADPAGASDRVAIAIRSLRRVRGWTAEQLAERCRSIGAADMTAAVIANIETGRRDPTGTRRRHVTVDELLYFAAVFTVRPERLLLGGEGRP